MLKILGVILILIVVASVIMGVSYNLSLNSSISSDTTNKIFIVTSGDNLKKITRSLYENGLIKSTFFFEIYLRRNNADNKIKAGTYSLNPSMKATEIADILTKGSSEFEERAITTIEGWTNSDIANYLEHENLFDKNDFLNAVKNPDNFSNYEILNYLPKNASMEGYLFPDTYRIFIDATIDDVIKKMLDNLDSKITAQMRTDVVASGKTLHQIITMASIIEKEVRSEADMKLVSGIFWNRISNGQALESCASLAYILGIDKPQYTLEDTKIDSLYNTYQHRGLPPGPISNPGLNAIMAAIYPASTDYNYFLSRPDTGETVFSKTYDEHLRNKNKYLQ